MRGEPQPARTRGGFRPVLPVVRSSVRNDMTVSAELRETRAGKWRNSGSPHNAGSDPQSWRHTPPLVAVEGRSPVVRLRDRLR